MCSLLYNLSVTGDCSNTNSGGFTVEIVGSAPDYSIQWVNPSSGTTALGVGVTEYTIENAKNEKIVVGFYRDIEEDDNGCSGNVWAIHLNDGKICHHLLHYIMKNV